MRRFIFTLFISISTIFSLQSEIIETKNFKEIVEYIIPETLVILDIDDTLLVPVQMVGTDVWFMSRLAHYKKMINEPLLALDKALAEWEAVRHLTDVKIVEERTDEIIDTMQKNEIVVMGLTTQGLALATRTRMQLKSLSIDLSKTAPSLEDHYFINGNLGVLYKQGILFTTGTAKGEALLKLLDKIDYHPKRVVFINDKKTHLEDVEKSVELANIEFFGLRYSFSDERVANYSHEIAEIQWSHSTFNRLLSDEEAEFLLKTICN